MWSVIIKLNVFLVILMRENELKYRRARIKVLTLQKNTLSFENIVRHEFVAFCWNQTIFALHESSSLSIQNKESKSRLNYAIIWKHLMFLAKIAQLITKIEIKSFVSDFQKIYEIVHFNLHQSKDTFNDTNATI